MAGEWKSVALHRVGLIPPVSSLFLIADILELLCAWIPKVDLTFTVTSI